MIDAQAVEVWAARLVEIQRSGTDQSEPTPVIMLHENRQADNLLLETGYQELAWYVLGQNLQPTPDPVPGLKETVF
jgi:hypothetical protein